MFDWIGLCMVLRPRLSNAVLHHMEDPTNSQSTEGKKLQRKTTQTTQRKHKLHLGMFELPYNHLHSLQINDEIPSVCTSCNWLITENIYG